MKEKHILEGKICNECDSIFIGSADLINLLEGIEEGKKVRVTIEIEDNNGGVE